MLSGTAAPLATYDQIPMSFEVNQGQTDAFWDRGRTTVPDPFLDEKPIRPGARDLRIAH